MTPTTPRQCRVLSRLLLLALASGPVAAVADELPSTVLDSFEGPEVPQAFRADGASIGLVSDRGVTEGSQALRVQFSADTAFSGVRITPDKPWDCGELGDCRLSFDATNVGPSSILLQCTVTTVGNVTARRSIAIPQGGPETIYFELVGDGVGEDRGLRDDPPSLTGVGRKMVVGGLKVAGDFSVIKSINFYVYDAAEDDVLVIDNLRFASNPPVTPGYLEGLVDGLGQSTRVDFPQKAESESELKRLANEELAALAAGGPLPDRSKFGGWKDGPQLEATGYFRTEKVDGKWSLVDPEGYLYFSNGIDNIRMSNTSTYTGVDFKDDSVRYRDPEDVTPEDSIGIVPSSDEARETSYVAYPSRHKMFTSLPGYDSPLAKYYGYRRSSHKGPIEHGEVFSFYLANLERRYGLPESGDVLDTWRQVTIDRMLNWGFTSFGNWVDASFYQMNQMPYFANGWIIGDFKTVSSGYDYWGPMPDPFDPEFARRAEVTTRAIAEEVQGNPWCVGVFIDNEKAWGNVDSPARRFGIVINTLARDAAESPTKAEFVRIAREKYGEIAKLNAAWGTSVESWDAFAAGFPKQDAYDDPEMLADLSVMSEAYAEKYFRTVHDALEKVLPHHMYLGCRMTPWGMTPESRRAASRYCDIMSYNFYREALGTRNWGFLPEIDKPSIIGEWHMGATDTGLPHAGIMHSADQEDRGRMYKVYMESVIDNPYFVGAHWFQYIDSPLTGRAHDGENYNVGFVTIADIPYKPLVEAAKEINRDLYQRRFSGSAAE